MVLLNSISMGSGARLDFIKVFSSLLVIFQIDVGRATKCEFHNFRLSSRKN